MMNFGFCLAESDAGPMVCDVERIAQNRVFLRDPPGGVKHPLLTLSNFLAFRDGFLLLKTGVATETPSRRGRKPVRAGIYVVCSVMHVLEAVPDPLLHRCRDDGA